MDAVEDRCEFALLVVTSDDLVGFGQRIERTLIREDAVVRGRFIEEVVVLSYRCIGLFSKSLQRNYECVYLDLL